MGNVSLKVLGFFVQNRVQIVVVNLWRDVSWQFDINVAVGYVNEVFCETKWPYVTFKVLNVIFAALYCHEAMPYFLPSRTSQVN